MGYFRGVYERSVSNTKPEEKEPHKRDEAALAIARGKVYEVFDSLGIPYEVVSHPPINSVADRERQGVVVDAVICKNLFLCNKDKNRYYLFTLPLDKRANLAALQKTLGETRFSFGDEEALWDMLRVTPGSVSLLNIIGARDNAPAGDEPRASQGETCKKPLMFLIDAETLTLKRIGLHPNDNAATIMFGADQLPKLLEHYGAAYEFVDLDAG